jgi:hypothetical protein
MPRLAALPFTLLALISGMKFLLPELPWRHFGSQQRTRRCYGQAHRFAWRGCAKGALVQRDAPRGLVRGLEFFNSLSLNCLDFGAGEQRARIYLYRRCRFGAIRAGLRRITAGRGSPFPSSRSRYGQVLSHFRLTPEPWW